MEGEEEREVIVWDKEAIQKCRRLKNLWEKIKK